MKDTTLGATKRNTEPEGESERAVSQVADRCCPLTMEIYFCMVGPRTYIQLLARGRAYH